MHPKLKALAAVLEQRQHGPDGAVTDDALTAYREGRDLATELGQYSVVLDNKVRTLETRLPASPEADVAEDAS